MNAINVFVVANTSSSYDDSFTRFEREVNDCMTRVERVLSTVDSMYTADIEKAIHRRGERINSKFRKSVFKAALNRLQKNKTWTTGGSVEHPKEIGLISRRVRN